MPISQINQNSLASTASFYGMKNRIINGAMVIDQRNAGASVSGTSSIYTLDRWGVQNNSGAARFNVQQNAGSVTPPVGFTNYLGITSTSAYSIVSTDVIGIYQRIEGYNIADLGWGTANAKTITISFQVYSSLTGTFGGSLLNSASNRTYPFTYSISLANTWTPISITIAGDTSGTWLTNNGIGIYVLFSMGTGSTYSGTAGSWSGSTYYSATGATSVVGTSGATFYITGVQLEQNTVASNFDFRSYGTELSLCQRYYENNYNGQAVGASVTGGSAYAFNASINPSNGYGGFCAPFKVNKRASPTTTLYTYNGTINQWHYGLWGQAETAFTTGAVYSSTFNFECLTASIPTNQNVMYGMFSASAEL
jgi:hypothetical protein